MSCGRSTGCATLTAPSSRGWCASPSSASRSSWSPAFGVFGLSKVTPTGFLPQDDQGAFFVLVQLPDGASVGRTEAVIDKVNAMLKDEHAIEDVSSIAGFNFLDGISQSNAAFLIVTLKPFEDRKDPAQSADAIIGRLSGTLRGVRGATVVPLAPPPIIGLGSGGGFAYVLQDTRGGDAKAMAQVLRGLLVAANQDPQLTRVFSTFSATNPSIYLDIDRDKAQILGVPLTSLFQTLQANLGGAYVNDFNLFGRTWQVQVQAEAADRGSIDDIYRLNVKGAGGEMVPLRSLIGGAGGAGAAVADPLQQPPRGGDPGVAGAPGVSSGAALAAMDAVAARTLPSGYRGDWTDTSFQEKRAEGQTGIILGFALLFAYLFLVALYESITIPVPVLLSVIVGVLGSYLAIFLGGLTLDLYGQIGMVVLDRVGREERHPDRGVLQGGTREGRPAAARRGRGGAVAVPPGDDDELCVHPGAVSAGGGGGAEPVGAAECRHAGVRRDDRGEFPGDFCHSDPVCGVPVGAGAAEGPGEEGGGCGGVGTAPATRTPSCRATGTASARPH